MTEPLWILFWSLIQVINVGADIASRGSLMHKMNTLINIITWVSTWMLILVLLLVVLTSTKLHVIPTIVLLLVHYSFACNFMFAAISKTHLMLMITSAWVIWLWVILVVNRWLGRDFVIHASWGLMMHPWLKMSTHVHIEVLMMALLLWMRRVASVRWPIWNSVIVWTIVRSWIYLCSVVGSIIILVRSEMSSLSSRDVTVIFNMGA